jgi:hypothetical protein
MAFENFLSYIEVDPNNHLSRTAPRVTFTGLIRNEDAYVYKDKGVGHFGDFTHLFHLLISNIANLGTGLKTLGTPWCLANNVGDQQLTDTTNGLLIYIESWGGDAAHFALILTQKAGGATVDFDRSVNLNVGTIYYVKVSRAANAASCEIRTGSHAGPLVDTLNITCNVTTYRYIYGTQSATRAGDPNWSRTGYVENLDLQEAVLSRSGAIGALTAAMKLTYRLPWRKRFPRLQPLHT